MFGCYTYTVWEWDKRQSAEIPNCLDFGHALYSQRPKSERLKSEQCRNPNNAEIQTLQTFFYVRNPNKIVWISDVLLS